MMRLALLTSSIVIIANGAVRAQESDTQQVKISKEAKVAIDRSLKWIAGRQNQDGSWSETRYPHNTAITAFALLAFMSQGHLPNQGYYSPEVRKGAQFLIEAQRKDGYVIHKRGNMYAHGMATLALAELWGMTGDNKIKPVLEKAINLIESSQNSQGGWRYEPRPTGADISVTVMQVMALRAAYNAGLNVKQQTIDKAINYIEACYHRGTGGFTYQPRNNSPGFARTAAGLCVLYLTGKASDYLKEKEKALEARKLGKSSKQPAVDIEKAVEFLRSKRGRSSHYWYGTYYAAHAMYQYGQAKDKRKEWVDWYHEINKELLPKQIKTNKDSKGNYQQGYWHGREGTRVGPVFATSIAVIVLSVPTHYLPIFQR